MKNQNPFRGHYFCELSKWVLGTWSSPIHLSPFPFQRLCFSEISNVPAGNSAGDSQDTNHLYPVSQGPAYTLIQYWGPHAWEKLNTITRMGIALNVVGPGALRSTCPRVRQRAKCTKCLSYRMSFLWFLLTLLFHGHPEVLI